ncbi:lipase family alpha/beta hydrolase [Sciscionella marina]|uniref:lipase family alpha/beta hydrolase n=1 Tax=Sciscionella marina TaxID=508770 RepID=UPI0012F6EE1C|nr:alpha/beta fold hydrolase [Sciscionella marina]
MAVPVLIVVLLLFSSAVSASAATVSGELPVPYGWFGVENAAETVFGNVTKGLFGRPEASPPGSNDWGCRPSAEHPNPVVLVHGYGMNQSISWPTIAPLLKNNGYCVYSLTYGNQAWPDIPVVNQVGGRDRMEDSAKKLGSFVDRVLEQTAAKKVDIVGHSEGSLMPDYYVKFLDGRSKVARHVAMAPLWRGSDLAGLGNLYGFFKWLGVSPMVDAAFSVAGLGGAVPEFASTSNFIKKLNQNSPAVPDVQYTSIITKAMSGFPVSPWQSGVLEGGNANNVVLQDVCPADNTGHSTLLFDPNVAQIIVNALDPGSAKKVQCQQTHLPPF